MFLFTSVKHVTPALHSSDLYVRLLLQDGSFFSIFISNLFKDEADSVKEAQQTDMLISPQKRQHMILLLHIICSSEV